jgi:hypothetical protein
MKEESKRSNIQFFFEIKKEHFSFGLKNFERETTFLLFGEKKSEYFETQTSQTTNPFFFFAKKKLFKPSKQNKNSSSSSLKNFSRRH